MNNYFVILVLALLLNSCASKKIPKDFEDNTIYKLIDERVVEKRYVGGLKTEKIIIPITSRYFVYRNYDTFYRFTADGKMKLITLPKKYKNTKEEILLANGLDGIYFETKKQKEFKYKQYDLAKKKIINKKATYQLKNDTLQITIDDYSYEFNKGIQEFIRYTK